MRGKNTKQNVFRLTPEALKLLEETAATTRLSKNDIVNLAVVYFCKSPLVSVIPLLTYATRRRRKFISYVDDIET